MYSGFLLQDTSHSYCETLRIPAAVQQDHFLLRYVQLHFLLIKYHSTSKCCITLWQSSVIFKHCMKLLSSEYCQLTAWSQNHIKKKQQSGSYLCLLAECDANKWKDYLCPHFTNTLLPSALSLRDKTQGKEASVCILTRRFFLCLQAQTGSEGKGERGGRVLSACLLPTLHCSGLKGRRHTGAQICPLCFTSSHTVSVTSMP